VRRLRALAALLAACAALGCKRAPTVLEAVVAPAAPDAGAPDARVVRFRAADTPSACVFAQGGPFLDFGEEAERWRLRDASGVEEEEREGASWWAVDARTLRAVVAMDPEELEGDGPFALDLRVFATETRTLSIVVNDRVVGALRVEPGPPRLETVRVERAALVVGDNTIALAARRATGARLGAGRVLVDWVHLHRATAATDKVARPTRRATFRVAARGGESHKAASLPEGASLACAMPLAPHAATTAAFAVEGSGEIEAEIRWRVAGQALPPLARVVLRGSEKTWSRVDGGAPPLEGTAMAALEVRVLRATQGSRLLVADLGWSTKAPEAGVSAPALDGVVVVVVSHVGLGPDTDALRAALATVEAPRAAVRFRSGALSGNAAIATLLAGQRPEAAGVLDPDAKAQVASLTLPRALKSIGIHTLYATGHPLGGAAHGFFVNEWDRAIAHAPNDASTAPLQDLADWLDQTKPERFFALVHVRGGHAPFDLRPAEAQALPPAEYKGTLDPAQVASWWSRHPRGPLRLTDADRTRLDALHEASLAKQTALLAKVVADVRRSYARSAVVVTTDVGFRPRDPQAYDEGVLLAHDALVAPLLTIGLPELTGEPVTLRDVHASVAEALGGGTLARSSGVPLWRNGRDDVSAVASGRARALWVGDLALESADGVDARLCAWARDPECRERDVPVPAAVRDGFRRLERELTKGPVATKREPVLVDGALERALRAWGL
jgi:hypothetical protein